MATSVQEQRNGAFTLSIIMLVLGLSIGLNIGLHQVCKNKDNMISTLSPVHKVQKSEQKEVIPKNLPVITDLK